MSKPYPSPQELEVLYAERDAAVLALAAKGRIEAPDLVAWVVARSPMSTGAFVTDRPAKRCSTIRTTMSAAAHAWQPEGH